MTSKVSWLTAIDPRAPRGEMTGTPPDSGGIGALAHRRTGRAPPDELPVFFEAFGPSSSPAFRCCSGPRFDLWPTLSRSPIFLMF